MSGVCSSRFANLRLMLLTAIDTKETLSVYGIWSDSVGHRGSTLTSGECQKWRLTPPLQI